MARRVGVVVALAALLVGGSACADGSSDVAGAARMTPGDYLSDAASTFPLVDGSVVHLGVADGAVSLSAGCNSLGSSYRLDGDVLVVEGVASTMMGCADDLADQDVRLAAFIEARPVVSTSPDGFTWTGADGSTLVFVDRAVADPDRPLEGTPWVLDGVVESGAVVSAVGFETVVLVFDDGTVDVTTGCSVGRTSYILDGDTLEFGALTLAPKPAGTDGCDQGVREAEAAVLAVVDGTATWQVRADTLEVAGGGGVGLSLRAG